MIKLKNLLEVSDDEKMRDWLRRRNIQLTPDGRIPAFHATLPKNVKSIKQNGFRQGTYFSTNKKYSIEIVANHHDIPLEKVVVFSVFLPFDAVDFVMADLFAIRPIKYQETI